MAPIRQYGLYGFTLQRALEARRKLGNESKQPRLKKIGIKRFYAYGIQCLLAFCRQPQLF
mgnify:CR=1 FL=1